VRVLIGMEKVMDRIKEYLRLPKREVAVVKYSDVVARQMEETIADMRRLRWERRAAIAKIKNNGNGARTTENEQ